MSTLPPITVLARDRLRLELPDGIAIEFDPETDLDALAAMHAHAARPVRALREYLESEGQTLAAYATTPALRTRYARATYTPPKIEVRP